MATLSVDFPRASEEYFNAFAAHLAARGEPIKRTGTSLEVNASTVDECGRLAVQIAEFIEARPETEPLRIDGPGATSTLYQVKKPNDTEMISSMLLSAAFLQ
jgi:hypothetical protein